MTDEKTMLLREKLTKRGIKYRTTEVHGMPVTLYESSGRTWSVTDHPNGYLVVNCVSHTPEQAIAATLGRESPNVDDALSLLDEIREAGRISYDDYSQLFDAVAELGAMRKEGKINEMVSYL